MELRRLGRYCIFIAALVVVILACSGTAWADGSKQVLSGEIDAVTIDDSVSAVVLNNVSIKDGGGINIKGDDVKIAVKGGTVNNVGIIQSNGDLRFVGSGDLNAMGIAAATSLTFDCKGVLTIEGGTIIASAGDLVFNSGTYNVNKTTDATYAFAALAGNIYLNGGDFNLSGSTCAVHSSLGAVVLAGGTLSATSEYVAIMGGDRISNGVVIGPSMKLADGMAVQDVESDDGSVISVVTSSDGLPAATVSAEGPAVEPGSVTADGATYVPAAQSEDENESTGVTIAKMTMIALVCIGVLVAIVIGIAAVRASSRKNNQVRK